LILTVKGAAWGCARQRVQHVADPEMEEMVDLGLELARVLGRDPEIGLRDVAFDQRHTIGVGPQNSLRPALNSGVGL
jgi:hypothetical protein